MTLLGLDVLSLRNTKATTSRVTLLIQSLRQYNHILSYSHSLIALLQYGELTPCLSIYRIHGVLVSPSCTTCMQFGGYVFLPGLQHCCLRCGAEELEFLPIIQNDASNRYRVRPKDLKKLPKLNILSEGPRNPYSQQTSTEVRYLISRGEASKSGRKAPKGRQRVRFRFPELYLAPLPSLDLIATTIDAGLRCLGCLKAFYFYGWEYLDEHDLPLEIRRQYAQHNESLRG